MTIPIDHNRDLIILEQIEQDPNSTQATLADRVGVAVGTINWHLKRLIEKGYVKATRLERKKLRYIITPEGIALRARLTMDYIHSSLEMYRLVRERMKVALREIQKAGYEQVIISGDGDVAEICRLTCLEKNIEVIKSGNVPTVTVVGLKVHIRWQKGSQHEVETQQDK